MARRTMPKRNAAGRRNPQSVPWRINGAVHAGTERDAAIGGTAQGSMLSQATTFGPRGARPVGRSVAGERDTTPVRDNELKSIKSYLYVSMGWPA